MSIDKFELVKNLMNNPNNKLSSEELLSIIKSMDEENDSGMLGSIEQPKQTFADNDSDLITPISRIKDVVRSSSFLINNLTDNDDNKIMTPLEERSKERKKRIPNCVKDQGVIEMVSNNPNLRIKLLSPMYKDVYSVVHNSPLYVPDEINDFMKERIRDEMYEEVLLGEMTYLDYLKQHPSLMQKMRCKMISNLICYRGNPFSAKNLNINAIKNDNTHHEYLHNFLKFSMEILGGDYVTYDKLSLKELAVCCYLLHLARMDNYCAVEKFIILINAYSPLIVTDRSEFSGRVGEPLVIKNKPLSSLSFYNDLLDDLENYSVFVSGELKDNYEAIMEAANLSGYLTVQDVIQKWYKGTRTPQLKISPRIIMKAIKL